MKTIGDQMASDNIFGMTDVSRVKINISVENKAVIHVVNKGGLEETVVNLGCS